MSSESLGRRAGFFAALVLFSSVLYFIGSKFGLLSIEYVYFITAIVILHVVYSVSKGAAKK
jgi:hypothetical protein